MAQIVERRRRKAVSPEIPKTDKATDPVCGMSVTIAGARHTAEVRGVAYYFCCAGCRTRFLEKGVSA
jgi:Cu+-exporting ATPase